MDDPHPGLISPPFVRGGDLLNRNEVTHAAVPHRAYLVVSYLTYEGRGNNVVIFSLEFPNGVERTLGSLNSL